MGWEEVLVAWMKSRWGEKVLVAWIKSLGVGEQAGGVNEEWRRCLGWVKFLWEWEGMCWEKPSVEEYYVE